ncbi:MAG: Prolipoprotein diacylglyceryl transferase [Candidatus Curtissbacteria bacterium GW2011_GWC2_38_9]|uniref:Phosphatidylglycerol--prolipoprotein diacylglyceryl transferase n=3 Tax=Candidatus Curtissiibacteriota TaxID=1752717 RepID=A0A1F5HRJ7_9BACT|nr:MAG: Prolipoprotein diacylglyceryl transferase [Candidatus Curtissbacteria bacterium GW2011_GWC2_38_9]KKS04645.1 MAG: Prolipoprotein diacylglyceryl transferase [Candidatus Curtissbacteria bacterium GW2011_GWA2_41_24]OGD88553.1 MAG: prolipoprotein diacylglyceryl transferase [Candidatus Curtissbacteria bacterium RIFCSPHIGHO2_02_39_8]OGE06772.1 MAG: prolipoprotein diacylglyceryl transferase [Candidatus Curtissbacteria bacterium RIFCSPLOWO2_02_41_11]
MIPREILLGPVTIHLYGLIITMAIFLGWFLAKKRAHFYEISKAIFDDPILLVPLVLAIVGARLYHVVDFWDYYSQNWNKIFEIWNGGLGIWGALVGAVLGFYLISKIKKIDLASILDLASPSLLLGQALGRFGNFINQEGFGPPTNLPWGIYIGPENRPSQFINSTSFHPTFFYEAILDFIFFLTLLFLSQKLKVKGQVFALYLIFYSATRFIAEFWRIDTWVIGDIKIAHVISILAFLLGIRLFILQNRRA